MFRCVPNRRNRFSCRPGELYEGASTSRTVPMYPVSSRSSRTAVSSGVSPPSINPAGNSRTRASAGGRYCRIRIRRCEGRSSAMITAAPAHRFRETVSQKRVFPSQSRYSNCSKASHLPAASSFFRIIFMKVPPIPEKALDFFHFDGTI